MRVHRIVLHNGAYRIEATSGSGKCWLLGKIYPTEKAATKRLRALQAMADADMPEHPGFVRMQLDRHV